MYQRHPIGPYGVSDPFLGIHVKHKEGVHHSAAALRLYSFEASLLELTPNILPQPQLQIPSANLHYMRFYAQRDDLQKKNSSVRMSVGFGSSLY